MPRRSILSTTERESLLALPDKNDFIRYYTFNGFDLSAIRKHRGSTNRFGFAVQLCYMRYPGIILGIKDKPSVSILQQVALQLKVPIETWNEYGQRKQTRREHLSELQKVFGFKRFTTAKHYQSSLQCLDELACQNDKGIVLATALINELRRNSTLLPSLDVIERICAQAITHANRQIYVALTEPLSNNNRHRLDALLKQRENTNVTWLAWMRQAPGKPNSRHILEHISRLKVWNSIDLPAGIEKQVHQNRLLKIAREGGQMMPSDLAKFELTRRYATLVALAIDGMATITDEIIDLHDRIIGKLFNIAKHKHKEQFHESGKSINDKVRLYSQIGQALLKAKQLGTDPFAAIESVLPWEDFVESIIEAQKLAQPVDFDFLSLISNSYTTLRRYTPQFLEILKLQPQPAAKSLFDAIKVLRVMNENDTNKLPNDAPTSFIKKRWEKLVITDGDIDRRYYELCVLSELKNALRSGDIWVEGSRQFKNFEDYLLSTEKFLDLKQTSALPLVQCINFDRYINDRLTLLKTQLDQVNQLAKANALPDAIITECGLKITPLDAVLPNAAQTLIDKISMMMPHVKITELLLEVDKWTGFTRHFTHLKSDEPTKSKHLLLTTILADAINLGLTKMAESCPDMTYAKLAWLQAWYVRDETYSLALAELVNAQFNHPFAKYWGDGNTSSSDGQRFKAASFAENTGHINPKYGIEPGRLFYTHISDQYAPFHSKVINVGIRDSTYVLDGLLYHESNLRIEEHYTDTAGFTDHVFAMMHLLGFRFAPRIRDLKDTKLYVPNDDTNYDTLKPLIGGTLNINHLQTHWDEILRFAASIKQGTATASLILKKLSSYPRQNGLAVALRELGRIERTLFILDWLQSTELRRRVHAGLNKGEARNALARAVFFNRLGEIRDRNLEHQRYRASGLNLVTAAIVFWNTVYLERAVNALRKQGYSIDDSLLQYLSPLGWEHINLNGDYVWRSSTKIGLGKFRTLRNLK